MKLNLQKPILMLLISLSFAMCTNDEEPTGNIVEPPTTGGDDPVSEDYYAYTPASHPEEFVARASLTDEFEGSYNTDCWEATNEKFAAWTFSSDEKYVKVEDGKLMLSVDYDDSSSNVSSGGYQCYFRSGMLRSKNYMRYGYYEASIKGADLWPGTCTAFWLYTATSASRDGVDQEQYAISYNEIDIIELQQIASNKDMLACNMHLYALDADLKNTEYKASKYPHLGQNQFEISEYWSGNDYWQPEDDFHTYAVENRPDSVVFYIDNKRVGAKANYFWHREDFWICFSLGLRTPFETYDYAGTGETVRGPVDPATVDMNDVEGTFPATMEIEWIRVWDRAGCEEGVYDESKFPSSECAFDPYEWPVYQAS